MDTIVLARIIGIVCLLVGLSFMNKIYTTAMLDEMVNNKAIFWLVGFILAVLGSMMLASYSVWSGSGLVLITILGWLALLKGMIIMLFPGFWSSFYKKFRSHGIVTLSGAVSLIFGIILLYQGFIR